MIPIKYRLDTDAEKEYIEKVLDCIGKHNLMAYSNRILQLLVMMAQKNIWLGKEILKQAYERYHKDYPQCYYLCMWLILSFERLAEIKMFLDEHIILPDLTAINMTAQRARCRMEKIKSYQDLRKRRIKDYTAQPQVKNLLSQGVRYDLLYADYKDLITVYEQFSANGINTWIIEKTEIKVCPYCDISYTYNRGNTVTAQLDHFFPKSEYPMFALCFYNLVPSCSACNKMKHSGIENMASPYSHGAFENLRITWNYKGTSDEKRWNVNNSLKALEDMIEIEIKTCDNGEKENLSKMKIAEAYQQHKDYAAEIIQKVKTYVNPDNQKLICSICESAGIASDEVERFYLGNYLEEVNLTKRPLSKMTRDFYEEYKQSIKRP